MFGLLKDVAWTLFRIFVRLEPWSAFPKKVWIRWQVARSIGGIISGVIIGGFGLLALVAGAWVWAVSPMLLGALLFKANVDVIRTVRRGEAPKRSVFDLLDPPPS